jgi:hypothetical protein
MATENNHTRDIDSTPTKTDGNPMLAADNYVSGLN